MSKLMKTMSTTIKEFHNGEAISMVRADDNVGGEPDDDGDHDEDDDDEEGNDDDDDNDDAR